MKNKTEDYKKGFQEGVRRVLVEMKLRHFLDGEFYVLKKEQFDWLDKLFPSKQNLEKNEE